MKNNNKQPSLQTIVEKMPGNVWWKNRELCYLGCNDRVLSVLGLSRNQFIGKTDHELWGKEIADELLKTDLHVLHTGETINLEEVLVEKDNTQVIMLTNKSPYYDKQGNIIGIVGTSTDITARKKMEEELDKAKNSAEAASKAKSEFIANMSHDLRLPLTGILGLTEGLIDVADNTLVSLQQVSSTQMTEIVAKYQTLLNKIIEVVREDGQLVLDSADELLQLLNEILETVRIESGKVSEKAESFDLRELVNHNIELTQVVARHRGLELLSEIDEHIPKYFSGLRNYLDRTLLNLLGNALKFTEKGFVKLKVELQTGQSAIYHPGDNIELKLTVQDTGIGIPKDKFKTIFEHFSRLTPSYQGIYKGAGLGLYTVNHYIEAMGAKIDVESEVGKGTRFIIKLPLTVSDHSDREKKSYRAPKPKAVPMIQARPSAKKEKAKEAEKTDATTRILIVEDNSVAAKSVQNKITHTYSHCACDKAENGKQALKMAEENPYDFVLMDIGLPDIDGIEVTRKIRALNNPQRAQVPIVALTGHGSNYELKKEALAAGMQDVLTKPLSFSELELLMKQYIFRPEEKLASRKETKFTKAEVQDITLIIDWSQCLKQYSGDEKLVRELLSALAIDLKMSQEKLAKAYEAHDDEALRAELHRVRGGVVCLTLPQLDKALSEFHAAVKAIPQNPKQLEELYTQVQYAMAAFLSYTQRNEM
jgi:two-component system, OmpR family, aerobic respiration control sensor histidine kinase ArcB